VKLLGVSSGQNPFDVPKDEEEVTVKEFPIPEYCKTGHCLDFDPEREETYIIEDDHYPIAGDKYLDKQRREEED
jgi:hypothetical protein